MTCDDPTFDPSNGAGDLHQRRDGTNAMLAPLGIVDGMETRGGIYFTSNTRTGFWLTSLGGVAVSIAGQLRLLVESDGLSIRVGRFFGKLTHVNTADREYTLPDESGTLALTSDLPEWVFKETPNGAVDGVNDTYTLDFTPVAGSEHLFKNGLLLESGYSIVGNTITMETPPRATPVATVLRVTYLKS